MSVDLDGLQDRAEQDGRTCAVGALVLDNAGRVFVHRRGPQRALLPGCWDIVGGHVEPGERLLEALRREVTEETGWQVAGTPRLAYVSDWEAGGVGRREFDFLVEALGDLEHPRLEVPHHVEARWLGGGDLDLLAENRGLDDGMIRHLAEVALRSFPPGELRFVHATLFLDPAAAAPIEAVRAEWDPAAADQIAAHVTVAYPDEVGTLEGLSAAASATRPFRLGLGPIEPFGDAEAGLFVAVEDVDGGWAGLRAELGLGPRAAPHVTVVHPRTTNRGPAAWAALRGTRIDAEVTVEAVSVTAFDGRRWLTTAAVALEM